MDDAFDLLIIGGGINGAGIARDAAGRGLSVLLVEQDDLARHTSSASSKLIHGGLRYLEYYEFRLVREALKERERLLAIAPHLIRPAEFVLPHAPGQRPAWMIRAGLFLYDHLAKRRRLPASRAVRLALHPAGTILKPGFTRGFTYADCRVDDSRLVVLNAMDAAARGAAIRTRTRLLAAREEGAFWRAEIADCMNGTKAAVRARAIVNAAGPWAGDVLGARLGRNAAHRVRMVKGSHIIVRRLYDGDFCLVLQQPDRRIIFAMPYEQDFTLIGTTDIPFEGDPARAAISAEETRYLCAGVNRYLRAGVAPGDVVRAYAGVRPLYDDHAKNASAVTRDYVLELTGGGGRPALLSVFGGKITTFRRLAEHALEKLAPLLGSRAGAGWTAAAKLPGGDIAADDFERYQAEFAARHAFLPARLAARLAGAYGTRAERVLDGAGSLAALGADLGGGMTEAEVAYLVAEEFARTAEDILWRRSRLALTAPPGTAERIAVRLAQSGAGRPE
jgi:glycerol-3-phosphate dehydrogenase